MSCDRYTTAIADHACGAELASDAAAHLTTCAACAARLAQQRRAVDGLDGELHQLLAVEPSVHFVPRVRAHVKAEATPRPRMFFLWSAGVAAVAVAIAAIAVTVREPRSARPIENTVASTAATAASASGTRTETPPAPGPVALATPKHEARRRVTTREPEVLVPPDQAHAVERYVALLHGGRLDTSSLAQEPAPVLTEPAELSIGAIAIKPIAIDELDPDTRSVAERRHDEEQRR